MTSTDAKFIRGKIKKKKRKKRYMYIPSNS